MRRLIGSPPGRGSGKFFVRPAGRFRMV